MMAMAPTSNLEGEFVNLRLLDIKDAELTLAWRSDSRARLLNVGAANLQQQINWISNRPASEYNYIIEMKNHKPIGMISLIAIDKVNQHAETSRFLIGDEDSAKGLPAAAEAMKLLYVLAFDILGLKRIYGTVASNNVLMIKWQKYLGMKEEGRLRSHYFIDGKWQDGVLLGLLVDEARALSMPRMNGLIISARKANKIEKKEGYFDRE
jgi:diamine N-acetyltransferase